MQMSDTIIIRGDVIMITRKAEKYINNWIKILPVHYWLREQGR